jgi:hypothetical protein
MAAAVGFLVIAAFEAALALGAPLGRAAMGGFYEGQLPMGLRIVAGVAVGVWLLAVLIVLGRAGFKVVPLPAAFLRWGTWGLVGLLFVGALMNIAASSPWERFVGVPVALILGVLCLIVARSEPVSGGRLKAGNAVM